MSDRSNGWRYQVDLISAHLGDDLHRRERGCDVVGAGWRLVLHVVEIVDEIVIWDKFVFNGLTFLVDNRVGVHSHWRLSTPPGFELLGMSVMS